MNPGGAPTIPHDTSIPSAGVDECKGSDGDTAVPPAPPAGTSAAGPDASAGDTRPTSARSPRLDPPPAPTVGSPASTSTLGGGAAPVESGTGKRLRPEQQQAVDRVKELWGRGVNSIVVAPTGWGKTLVASTLIRFVMNADAAAVTGGGEAPPQFVAVIVPTTVLACQQGTYLRNELPSARVGIYYGGMSKPQDCDGKFDLAPGTTAVPYKYNYKLHGDLPTLHTEATAHTHDAVVMTPAKLAAAFEEGTAHSEHISAVVFDEVHWATKEHPYAKLAQELERRSGQGPQPLLVGLSASPALAKTRVAAQQNLDMLKRLLRAELVHASRKPEACQGSVGSITVPVTPLQRQLLQLFELVASELMSLLALAGPTDGKAGPQTTDLSDVHNLYLALEAAADPAANTAVVRVVADYVRVFGSAMWCLAVGPKEAMEAIDHGTVGPVLGFAKPGCGIDLVAVAERARAAAPRAGAKLGKLRELLPERVKPRGSPGVTDGNPHPDGATAPGAGAGAGAGAGTAAGTEAGDRASGEEARPAGGGLQEARQAVVFFGSRWAANHAAVALRTGPTKRLNTQVLVGKNVPTNRREARRHLAVINKRLKNEGLHLIDPMHTPSLAYDQPQSASEQEEAVARFREGKADVLLATSVAEEGLDIGRCGVVIQMDAVQNNRALVQRRGRARAAGSEYIAIEYEHEASLAKAQEQVRHLEAALRADKAEQDRDEAMRLRGSPAGSGHVTPPGSSRWRNPLRLAPGARTLHHSLPPARRGLVGAAAPAPTRAVSAPSAGAPGYGDTAAVAAGHAFGGAAASGPALGSPACAIRGGAAVEAVLALPEARDGLIMSEIGSLLALHHPGVIKKGKGRLKKAICRAVELGRVTAHGSCDDINTRYTLAW